MTGIVSTVTLHQAYSEVGLRPDSTRPTQNTKQPLGLHLLAQGLHRRPSASQSIGLVPRGVGLMAVGVVLVAMGVGLVAVGGYEVQAWWQQVQALCLLGCRPCGNGCRPRGNGCRPYGYWWLLGVGLVTMGVGLVAIGSFSGVGLVAKSVGLKAINFGNQMWLLVTFQVQALWQKRLKILLISMHKPKSLLTPLGVSRGPSNSLYVLTGIISTIHDWNSLYTLTGIISTLFHDWNSLHGDWNSLYTFSMTGLVSTG